MIDRETALAMAMQSGFDDAGPIQYANHHALHTLVNAAYKRGLEDAAAMCKKIRTEVVDDRDEIALQCEIYIRALKEQP